MLLRDAHVHGADVLQILVNDGATAAAGVGWECRKKVTILPDRPSRIHQRPYETSGDRCSASVVDGLYEQI